MPTNRMLLLKKKDQLFLACWLHTEMPRGVDDDSENIGNNRQSKALLLVDFFSIKSEFTWIYFHINFER